MRTAPICLAALLAAVVHGAEEGKAVVVKRTYDVSFLALPDLKPDPPSKKDARGAWILRQPQALMDPEGLAQEIQCGVHPATWDTARGTDIEARGDFTKRGKLSLIVRQTAEVHQRIAALVDSWREAMTARPGTVTVAKGYAEQTGADGAGIEYRFYSIPVETDQTIKDTLKKAVKPETWGLADQVRDYSTQTGRMLVVYQTPEVHELIPPFLAKATGAPRAK
jgi:hypothetical protein